MAFSDWSTTASNNTALGAISIAEGVMRVPAVNNAFREMMAQLKAGVAGRVASTTDNAIARYDGTTGEFQNSAVTIDDSGNLFLPNTGLRLKDSNASHNFILTFGSDATSDRLFTILTGDAARTLTVSGDSTINQDVSTAGTPTHAGLVLTGSIRANTSDGSDNSSIAIGGGGAISSTRGGDIVVAGNEHAEAGSVLLEAGNASGAAIKVFNGPLIPYTNDGSALGTTTRMWSDLFLASGAVINFNNGDVTLTHNAADSLLIATTSSMFASFHSAGMTIADDTGAQTFGVTAHSYVNADGSIAATKSANPPLQLSRITNTGGVADFYDDTTFSGNVTVNGATCAYNTSSDQAWKEDDGEMPIETAYEIVRLWTFHNFRWNEKAGPESVGKADEGVFAQELYKVWPKPVTPGGWTKNEDGTERYVPWSVDYSKMMVPVARAMQGVLSRLDALEKAA